MTEGLIAGCTNLGVVEYFIGNIDEAVTSFRKACDGGDLEGCTNLGVVELERGNYDEALAPFRKACDGENRKGCYYKNLTVNKSEEVTISKFGVIILKLLGLLTVEASL